MESKNPIQVADKLFLVLETLAKTGPIGLSDLCREVSLNKTTVHRLLNSLLYMGYVRQDTQTSRYSLSFKIWDIANQFVSKIDIVEEARPSLRELAAKTGETVHLVQIDGIHAIYIAKEESENSVRLVSMVGKRIPLYCSGVGKALLADMSNEAVEYVRGVPVVKTFGQTIFSFKRFKNAIDNYETWVIAYTKGLRLPMMFYTTAINSVFAFLIAGGILFTRGGVTNELLLNLIFYIVITPVIGTTLTKIMFMSEDAMIVGDAINRINEVLNEKPLSESSVNNIPKDNGITLEHVSYSYDGKKNALNDVSLSIKPGQTVALVGSSGGGKTTLANIVTRFFDPQKGRVLIGNIDICDIPKETLMNKVSFVFQNSRLIKASILENVRMAKPDATREEIAHALEAAQCLDIIEKLPNGIDTVVGAKGVYLSGGEQQRIAIARAILKNAPIIILDEATAFADPDNEVRVQQALSALSKGKTVIMIAHRLSSITDADCIYVLQDGEIVESGTHSGLIERNGIFTKMWKDYSEAAEWKIAKEVNA